MQRTDWALGVLWLMLGLSMHAHAVAHDPPAGNGVYVQGSGLLVRTNRGLVLRNAGTSDFKLLCNEALGINTAETPSIVALRSGEWLIATSHGAMIASADLCSLEAVPNLDAVAIPALALDPSDDTRIFASTGQADFDNGLYLSADGAKTFTVHGATDQNRLYDRVLVSVLDPSKLYASGLRRMDGVVGFVSFFAVSTDGGEHFVEHEIALHDDEYAIELLGAHPVAIDTVYGVAHADLGTGIADRFLKSTDDAATFETKLSVDKVEAFAIDDDGDTVWVGARGGLWRSTNAGETFEQIQSSPVHCLARSGTSLYVCDDRDGAAGLSVSDDQGATLTRVMTFTEVTSRVSCAASSNVTTSCAVAWADWQRELALGFSLDAGTQANDAGAADSGMAAILDDAGAPTRPMADDAGCSCSAPGAGGPGHHGLTPLGLLACVVTASLVIRVRRRSRGA